VSALVLSLANPVILDQVSDNEVLKLLGRLDPAAPGPCNLRIVPAGEEGLRGAGEPVSTAVTVGGMTFDPDVIQASVTLAAPGG
jgi:hypothetical protein